MARTPVTSGNWKMHTTLSEAITLAQEVALVGGAGLHAVRQKADRVGIPRGNVQIGTCGEMVKIGDLAHVVVRNRRG